MTLHLYKTGDVAGIGWERSEGTPPPPGQAPKGRVYFTYCGQRLSPILEDVAGGMWPLVHIQKKVTLKPLYLNYCKAKILVHKLCLICIILWLSLRCLMTPFSLRINVLDLLFF